MDCPKLILSDQKEESISKQRVNKKGISNQRVDADMKSSASQQNVEISELQAALPASLLIFRKKKLLFKIVQFDLTLCILMDSSIWFDTINLEYSI